MRWRRLFAKVFLFLALVLLGVPLSLRAQLAAECGNGVVEAGEHCDDGNRENHDACPNNCTLEDPEPQPEPPPPDPEPEPPPPPPESICGNSLHEEGEECDDGNIADGDGCSSICIIEVLPPDPEPEPIPTPLPTPLPEPIIPLPPIFPDPIEPPVETPPPALPPVVPPVSEVERCIPQEGDFCSHTQEEWGTNCVEYNGAGCRRDQNFLIIFPRGLVIGANLTMTFTSSTRVNLCLPSVGIPTIFTQNEIDPSSQLANSLAGETIAVTLNTAFSDAQATLQASLEKFGDLKVSEGSFTGQTVRSLLNIANQTLGGDLSLLESYHASLSELTDVLAHINRSFIGCRAGDGFLTSLCVETVEVDQAEVNSSPHPSPSTATVPASGGCTLIPF